MRLRVPQRGDKRALIETVERNAEEAFTLHKLRRAGDLTARSAALQEIQDALGLDTAPLRIECVDVSHVQGSDVVASLVVFEDGLARKSDYRRFEVRGGADGGDVAAIAEVVRRRFRRYLNETADGVRPGTTARRPTARDDAADRAPLRPGSTRTPAGPASSPTRRTCSSWTAGRRRSRRPRTCSPSWASPTSRSAGWPSGWRRSGCRPTRTR